MLDQVLEICCSKAEAYKLREQLQADYARRLKQCKELRQGSILHQEILRSGLGSNRYLSNLLVSMYSKCGSFEQALMIFDKIEKKNCYSWNIIIAAYAQNGFNDEAITMWWRMLLEGVKPDSCTLSTVLDACSTAGAGAVPQGQTLHRIAGELGASQDLVLTNSLIEFYGRNGLLETAKEIFDESRVRDAVSWTSLLGSYAQHGYSDISLQLFFEMQLDGVTPDRVTFLNVLHACSQGGFFEQGMILFASAIWDYWIQRSWKLESSMADLLGRAGMLQQAEQLINSMEFEDSVCWTSLLNSCRMHDDVHRGERVARKLLRLDPGCDSGFVMLSSMFSAGRPDGSFES